MPAARGPEHTPSLRPVGSDIAARLRAARATALSENREVAFSFDGESRTYFVEGTGPPQHLPPATDLSIITAREYVRDAHEAPVDVLCRRHIFRWHGQAEPRAAVGQHQDRLADPRYRDLLGGAVRRGEAGFTLVEVLIAFAIVALVLASIYHAIAEAYRGEARAQAREQALAQARAH